MASASAALPQRRFALAKSWHRGSGGGGSESEEICCKTEKLAAARRYAQAGSESCEIRKAMKANVKPVNENEISAK